jgi:SAM-dependent MidA family methyltransferase
MTGPTDNLLPLGDFLPSDRWQTHVNAIFYGTIGSDIHDHFQTYVSRDYRLAYSLAKEFFIKATVSGEIDKTLFVLEWGVGNGNLASSFLDRLKEIDEEGLVYPRIKYVLCDFSPEILKVVINNSRLKKHEGRFVAVQVDAESMKCFKPKSIFKIISNEIWDDLSCKAILLDEDLIYEEYLQPYLDPSQVPMDWDEFLVLFKEKNLERLRELPLFLGAIRWERNYQRVDISDWPFADEIQSHIDQLTDENVIPINVGAFESLKTAFNLLSEKNIGYTGMDYGMLSIEDVREMGRPYFNLYGGQYTFMVNFPLLEKVAKTIGFTEAFTQYQHHFVECQLQESVISVLELLQSHPKVARMESWERDILMLQTLNAFAGIYESPYENKINYPAMPGTPKKYIKKIDELSNKLDPYGIPDTVAYISQSEVVSAEKKLRKLGYKENRMQSAFVNFAQPVSFVYSCFEK